MLICAKSLDELDFSALMGIYVEANDENGAELWPDEEPLLRRELAEQAFYAYLRDGFYGKSHGNYYVLKENGESLAALRLEAFLDGLLLEALETRPDSRRMGYAKKLVESVLAQLPLGTKVYSHVSKTNEASLATHRSCGFEIAYNYGLYANGERYDHQVTFLHTS